MRDLHELEPVSDTRPEAVLGSRTTAQYGGYPRLTEPLSHRLRVITQALFQHLQRPYGLDAFETEHFCGLF